MRLPADEFREDFEEFMDRLDKSPPDPPDQQMLRRLKQAPTKRIFTIPVGHLSPGEAIKTIRYWREKFKDPIEADRWFRNG